MSYAILMLGSVITCYAFKKMQVRETLYSLQMLLCNTEIYKEADL